MMGEGQGEGSEKRRTPEYGIMKTGLTLITGPWSLPRATYALLFPASIPVPQSPIPCPNSPPSSGLSATFSPRCVEKEFTTARLEMDIGRVRQSVSLQPGSQVSLFLRFLLACLYVIQSHATWAGENNPEEIGADSITAKDLQKHVHVLASDTFEGRPSGGRGGQAAGIYLAGEYQRLKLRGSVSPKTYFQDFGYSQRNILGVIRGSDDKLRDEVLLISAHYDHVGYGNAENSNGPIGFIHNGADDNASGTAAVLEVAEAWVASGKQPRRSLIFALWDGEENGLLGSNHWVSNPTVPLDKVRLMVNMDMVGRLRAQGVEVSGSRTIPGIRKLSAEKNRRTKLKLDFFWDVKDDSDHWPFYQRSIPFFMPFTGFHEDYHRPSDDVDKVNYEGAARISQWIFLITAELADRESLPTFRREAYGENQGSRQYLESSAPAIPPRLGARFSAPDSKPGRAIVNITPGSPAAIHGLRIGERVLKFGKENIAADTDLGALVLRTRSPVTVTVADANAGNLREISIPLTGDPLMVGVTWREDAAEPGVVILSLVVPDSPAARAGLRVADRVTRVNQRPFANGKAFHDLLVAGACTLEVEREGVFREVNIEIPELIDGQ